MTAPLPHRWPDPLRDWAWRFDNQGQWSGRVTLEPVPLNNFQGLAFNRATMHRLCEYVGAPRPLQLHLALKGSPMHLGAPNEDGDWDHYAPKGAIRVETAQGWWLADLRSGVYHLPSSSYISVSVARYTHWTEKHVSAIDEAPAVEVMAAILPGQAPAPAEWVATAFSRVLMEDEFTIPLDLNWCGSAYRYYNAWAQDTFPGDLVVIRAGELLRDYGNNVTEPPYPRVELPSPTVGGQHILEVQAINNAFGPRPIAVRLYGA